MQRNTGTCTNKMWEFYFIVTFVLISHPLNPYHSRYYVNKLSKKVKST